MLAWDERRNVVGELNMLEGTVDGPQMLIPPTMAEKAESFEVMLDGLRILMPPTVDEEVEWPKATMDGP